MSERWDETQAWALAFTAPLLQREGALKGTLSIDDLVYLKTLAWVGKYGTPTSFTIV